MSKRILITGSRDWTDRNAVWDFLNRQAEPGAIVVHGDCPTGADHLAKQWCSTQPDVEEEPHPALWKLYGKAAGPMRNSQMVHLGADICGAFLLPDSRGTVDCRDKALAADIEVVEHHG